MPLVTELTPDEEKSSASPPDDVNLSDLIKSEEGNFSISLPKIRVVIWQMFMRMCLICMGVSLFLIHLNYETLNINEVNMARTVKC